MVPKAVDPPVAEICSLVYGHMTRFVSKVDTSMSRCPYMSSLVSLYVSPQGPELHYAVEGLTCPRLGGRHSAKTAGGSGGGRGLAREVNTAHSKPGVPRENTR